MNSASFSSIMVCINSIKVPVTGIGIAPAPIEALAASCHIFSFINFSLSYKIYILLKFNKYDFFNSFPFKHLLSKKNKKFIFLAYFTSGICILLADLTIVSKMAGCK
ncbi:hypothetical protein ASZ90_007295 [hydrocarbon metagenome]|uniref:Uncharacterized protein n=1 Tax=hydrocarbon metagenome TaxID=938273 RepID=A0A0W8FPW7_9ZZZZ